MNELEQANPSPVAKDVKIIKRYTNRKLYDTVESRYVTLDEIAEMIKQGGEVKIVDNRSKEDLTSVTLAQIIFEEEKKKNRMPLTVLREIIRHPGESISGFIQKEVSPRVASLLGREENATGEGVSPSELLRGSQRVLEEWQRRIDDRVKTVVENLAGNIPAAGRDITTLNQRLESLEKKLEELEHRD